MTQNPVVENIVETAKHAQANQTRLWPYGLIFGLLVGGLATADLSNKWSGGALFVLLSSLVIFCFSLHSAIRFRRTG
jgi:hypothetical protein